MALGAGLAPRLGAGDVVCLWGGLGAGKTTFARGAISAWTGRDEEAPSPTYTLVQTYEGPAGSLWHMDLYRLAAPEQAYELGIEEAFAQVRRLPVPPPEIADMITRSGFELEFGKEK